jgi:hypothetical protein
VARRASRRCGGDVGAETAGTLVGLTELEDKVLERRLVGRRRLETLRNYQVNPDTYPSNTPERGKSKGDP